MIEYEHENQISLSVWGGYNCNNPVLQPIWSRSTANLSAGRIVHSLCICSNKSQLCGLLADLPSVIGPLLTAFHSELLWVGGLGSQAFELLQ